MLGVRGTSQNFTFKFSPLKPLKSNQIWLGWFLGGPLLKLCLTLKITATTEIERRFTLGRIHNSVEWKKSVQLAGFN